MTPSALMDIYICYSHTAATDNCAPTPSLIPRITLHPSPLTAPPGIREKLECWAERAVCYDWYRNGKPVSTEKQNGVLWFESLSDKDNGKYYCEAVNDHGRAESRVVQVAVGTSGKDI